MSMQAGLYYVGDLCYVMDSDEWTEVCNLTLSENGLNDGEFELSDGRRFALYSTAYGDGTYSDQQSRSYSVDAGCIGCILASDIKADKYDNLSELGAFIEFEDSFVTGSYEGSIYFGSVKIDTSQEDCYDEEEDYDE